MIDQTKSAERFWSRVEKTPECWTWTRACYRNGYGAFSIGGRNRLAHRVAWFLTYGEWPDRMVLHSCDNRRCVRPDHLFLGTAKDNTRDMMQKGRGLALGRFPNAKLTEADVVRIKELRGRGQSQGSVARAFGVNAATVREITKGESWVHVHA